MEELLDWIYTLNRNTHVKIKKTCINEDTFWFYDDEKGIIRNRNNSFFSISGIKGYINDEYIEQPIIIQKEIGYLGIICKDFDGITKYLMQAKIEPGNINCVQISPTIQATKSNFTQKHGGNKPLYLDYFINAKNYQIIVDQIQSEQSSRFYGKRNRNMIIKVDEDVPILNHRFKWMSLKEIKELMKYKNLVNMDTRTVLSGLPLFLDDIDSIYKEYFKKNSYFYNSVFSKDYHKEIGIIYHKINNYKMFGNNFKEIVRLDELSLWKMNDDEIKCENEFPYKVIYCDIEIEGREVTKWMQPLFQANGVAIFGLIRTVLNNEVKYLIKIKPEIGCFDDVEIGPTIQKESGESFDKDDIEKIFFDKIKHNSNITFDSIMSEEGGRFYHEENRNLIVDIEYHELPKLPDDYILVSYRTLNHLNMINNCLNIQLRNLMSVLEVE